MFRMIAALCVGLLLAGCNASPSDLDKPAVPIGAFKLGHAEVVAPNLEKLLISQEASEEELIAAVDGALEERFRRYEGTQFYHIGVSVEAYSIPPSMAPGKSAIALRATIWDDALGKKLNEETELFHVIRVFESRLGLSREDQIKLLAEEGALLIEKWMREQHAAQGWFDERPGETPGE